MIKLIKVKEYDGRYTFDSFRIEADEIKTVESAHSYNRILTENADMFPDGLDSSTQFVKIGTSTGTHVVVGTPDRIDELKRNSRRILKG